MNQNPLPENLGATPDPAAGNPPTETQASDAFPIIGIGASAGGFEALEQFMARLPVGCDMAVVIVQHLDPTRKGLMPELLQRATTMKVLQVKERTRVRPDSVYVIPPNKDMSILRGVLHLSDPAEKRGRRLPIDFFLHTLAKDRGQRAVGVILSGIGSDGTAGMQSIREHGGLTVAQEPGSAKFDSMPRSTIDAGLADIVAPAGDLPDRIIAHFGGEPRPQEVVAGTEPNPRSSLEKILVQMRTRTGHDFSH